MLAKVLDVNPSFLTKTLYLTSDELKYKSFEIPKRNGDPRTIYAPNKELKDLQSRLSALLLDCIDEINKERKITPKLSHGFVREGANKRGNSSRLTQSFHFFMFEPIFSPVNALNQPI
ncbi:hypothetical protein ACPW74_03675 [Aeromonas sp. INTO2]|uniref:Uncharacterized protein n=1 Tax=Aeromonas caviae TaxID=648 RepID=A0AA42VDW6_AERCA|nr:hypothetical protein [Aeromonas caviae]MDH1899021.1 hypothetical protein [Aeromonas caviae]